MKRFLALILALLVCVSFLVSCNKEEEQGSSGLSTSSDEQNKGVDVEYMIGEPYQFYISKYISFDLLLDVSADPYFDNGYRMWTLTTYEEYRNFFERTISDAPNKSELESDIKSEDLDENVVVALYCVESAEIRFGKVSPKRHAWIRDDGEYIMMAERTYRVKPYDGSEPITGILAVPASRLYYILVPRSDMKAEKIKSIDIICYSHTAYPDRVEYCKYVEYFENN